MNELPFLREWSLALSVLLITVIASAAVSSFLKKSGKTRGWPSLTALAPSLSHILYILGLTIFSELAPLKAPLNTWLESGIYVVAVVILLSMVRRAALIGVEWSANRSTHSRTLQQGFIPLLRNLITLFVFFTGSIMILKRFNYDVLSLVTALGVGSLAVGLAAKETLSNMISGFTLIIDRNFRPGDRINLGGSGGLGDVEEIGLRSTRIRTPDGNTLIVPNSELVNTKILNLSLPTRETTCSTTIKLPLEVPFSRARELCLETIDQVRHASGRGKWVNLSMMADGFQSLTIGFWLREMDDASAAVSEFHEKLLTRFQAEQISIYVPPTFALR
jgi:small-conductance mechanosensitive channel